MGNFIGLEGGGRAYVSEPSSQATGGVVVFHAWWGLTAVFEEVCHRLATNGFLALCPDLYGGRTASTVKEAQGLLEADQSTARTTLALRAADAAAVRAQPIAALGFSMGGDYAVWAATQRSEITKVVTFYGGSEQDAYFPTTITAEIQGHFAADDEWESADAAHDLEARLQAAGRVAEFFFYDAGHWFLEPDRDAYDPAAASLAWERTLEFLRRDAKGEAQRFSEG